MNELLQALSQEIRQTSRWLLKEKTPDTSSIRFRLHTLREAAATAEMKTVDLALAKIESRLEGPAPAGVEEILDQLSKLLLSLAKPILENEQLWLADLGTIENDVKALAKSMDQSSARLMMLASIAENVLMKGSENIPVEELLSISRSLRDESGEAQRRRTYALRTVKKLHRTSRALMKDFSTNSWIPLDPAFARLREKVHKWSKANTNPVALRCTANKTRVGIKQYEDIIKLLDFILDEIMKKGLDDPENRNKAGKATVAGIAIGSSMEQNLVQMEISHDGVSKRAFSLPSDARDNLRNLRARLWMDESTDIGQRLVLQLPLFFSTVEAIKIRCDAGEIFVPVGVLHGLVRIPGDLPEDLSRIYLDRRTSISEKEHLSHGLIFSLGYWQGYLPCNILSPAKRIIVNSPREKDPLWVLGRTDTEKESSRVLHPLALSSTPTHWRPIFPMETKS